MHLHAQTSPVHTTQDVAVCSGHFRRKADRLLTGSGQVELYAKLVCAILHLLVAAIYIPVNLSHGSAASPSEPRIASSAREPLHCSGDWTSFSTSSGKGAMTLAMTASYDIKPGVGVGPFQLGT